jgi:E3 ubiquitin-protein ligase makorin
LDAEEWVNAPEFIPSSENSNVNVHFSLENCASGITEPLSYAQVVNPSSGQSSFSSQDPLCPQAEATGFCKKMNCPYLHGDICDMCSRPALHPHNEELRKKHTNVRIG